ncbi:MAG: multiheme c-type cytochrome [Gammaproteobacteria bacterium]|nr:multiheme c-type cytochrome [Gammaproteobacteria bacterium]
MVNKRSMPLAVVLVMLLVSACQAQNAPDDEGFVGSEACRDCHTAIYDRWRGTLMANIIVDVDERPEAILGDFSTSNSLVTFDRDDIVFAYGSKWKQRYFTRVDGDYFVLPAQWDVMSETWRRYNPAPGTEWWTAHYPADQMERPTGPLCDGCHSTNYDIETKGVTEWNVGCEKCHGAGADHVANPTVVNVVNPARLDHVRGNDVCIQCHSQGQPLSNPINGLYFDWPVGYQPGERLAEYWRFEEHHLGEETATHWPDGSAHKNRMQGNDYVTSSMYIKNVSCWDCHDVHGTEYSADLIKPAETLCLTCHGPESPAGPRGTPITQHTQHSLEKGVECVDCHMPLIARTVGDVNVRSHTFRFVSPASSDKYGIPNPCTSCHTDMTDQEAAAELTNWGNISPWRVAQ